MFRLLALRSFRALTVSQFLGAFNDNAFKQLVLLVVVSVGVGEGSSSMGSSAMLSQGQWLPQALFALPFVVFGALTGSLADRVSKTSVIRAANLLEVAVMALGVAAFAAESYPLLLACVLLMGAQSALFGPSKYGSIVELVGRARLSQANALVQMTTMIAILGGAMLAGGLHDGFAGRLWVPGGIFVLLALAGWVASLWIEPLPAASPGRELRGNVLAEVRRHWRAMEGQRPLVLSVVASAFFYLVGATLLPVVNLYGRQALGLDGTATSLLNAMTVLGIAVGAILAGTISRHRIEAGLIPLGLLGMAGFLLLIGVAPDSAGLLRLCLFGLGLCGGLFSVPIRALVQVLPRRGQRGAVLGLSQTLDFVGILLAAGLYGILEATGLAPHSMMLVLGVGVLVFALSSLLYTAEFLVRLLLYLFTHTIYRARVRGLEHLPREGGALLVANHVSYVDAMILYAISPRPVRFVIHKSFLDVPLVGWFVRRMGAIPVASGDPAVRDALESAASAARGGELVCIFAEGAITRNGTMNPFRRGMERIARDAQVPIVPVALDRLWGSIFSFEGGRIFWKVPQRIPYPIDVAIGEPVASDTPAWRVRELIQTLVADGRRRHSGRRGSLGWRFLHALRARGNSQALVDSTGKELTARQLIVGTLALRKLLREELTDAPNVGVLLPPGAAGTLVNAALALMGKTSVNLNYTLTGDAMRRCCELAGVERVITANKFLEALEREAPLGAERALILEDLMPRISTAVKLRYLLVSFLPKNLLANWMAPRISSDEVATIIFSSGSTGDPKGVELTHGNVLSNAQSFLQLMALEEEDGVLGILPLFHSFGYTVTFWGTFLGGARGIYHANPLDAKVLGELAEKYRATMLIATPTFYQTYLRRCTPEQFATLRFCASGAERLRPALADRWRERFGLELYEGYGCTELSPAVSINLPPTTIFGQTQIGHKAGSVGRALPGVALRVVDLDTGEHLGPDQEGMLLVKGPNLMKGYLGNPEATAEVIQDGWYVTGDVARIDADGFVVLTDRLSRFSKLAGEMVPHGKVESVLNEIVLNSAGEEGEDLPELVVTAVPDEQKGERLVVLYTHLPMTPPELLEAAVASEELPRLFVPRGDGFRQVEEIPKLGSGKVDLRGVKQLALELFAEAGAGS